SLIQSLFTAVLCVDVFKQGASTVFSSHILTFNYDCFWVAEAEVDGRPQVLGMVAVMAKHSGKEKHGELFRMIISQQCRRLGLGLRLAHTVIDFCKERGFSKVVLETSSTQMAAVALYSKLGFSVVVSHTTTEAASWVAPLARVTIFKMEKSLNCGTLLPVPPVNPSD
uniref:N-acetyltransferase 8-like 2 n=1 Tax=Acanthochromis polyacanthus TaxID=80966 RepID=A0A3Q1FZT0_9TELE